MNEEESIKMRVIKSLSILMMIKHYIKFNINKNNQLNNNYSFLNL